MDGVRLGEVDEQAAWDWLSREAYWGRERTREDFATQVRTAWRLAGLWRDGRMVGFARAVGDGVSIAYLADVYVEEPHRGGGQGRALVQALLDEGTAQTRWLLFTRDMHPLYRQLGFEDAPATVMVRPATG